MSTGTNKGHASLTGHGHGTRRKKENIPPSSNRQKARETNKAKVEEKERANENVEVMKTEDETIFVTPEKDGDVTDRQEALRELQEEEEEEQEDQEKEEEKEEETVGEMRRDPEKEEEERRRKDAFAKCTITPENFNVREFNTNMTEFVRSLSNPRYTQVDADYPVDELVTEMNMVAKSVNDYRAHTSDTQGQLAALREAMKAIRENLHFSVSREAMDLSHDDGPQTQEERDLHAKATALNAALAQANADVSEAIRLATETESSAVKANLEAERAREEARRIQEEVKLRTEVEEKRRKEEKRKMEEMKRQKEEQERKEAEEQRKKEEEWKRREAATTEKKGQASDTWPLTEYEWINERNETEVSCIARGRPGSFDKNNIIIQVTNDKEAEVPYVGNEELISNVLDLRSPNGDDELKSPVLISIPHVMNRSSALSREPVIKAKVEGQWEELPTRDVTFEKFKDTKFAQAEVRHLTTLVVMSRCKRDYVTLTPRRTHKVTSSFDQRVTLTVDKKTLENREHFLLQVQPVDSNTIHEYKQREAIGKSLLTSSPIVHTTWETTVFNTPVLVTLPCPPNPAKAKKMALARKLKEEKMKNPQKAMPPPIDELEKEKEREKEKKRLQQFNDSESGGTYERKQMKWFMGQYANNEDDERDQLYFIYSCAGKWFVDHDMQIKQVKVDVVAFSLTQPIESFMVLRTRTGADEDTALTIVSGLTEYLNKRFVEAVVRQRTDDPYQVALQVTPVSRLEAVLRQLELSGFEAGPSPSHVVCLHEGDVIEVGFSGNLECVESRPTGLMYKSNIPTVTYLRVKEENKFRQKEQDVYSGLITLSRRYAVAGGKGRKQAQGEEHDQIEEKRERLCALQINVPKDLPAPTPRRSSPILELTDTAGPVDRHLLQTVASGLGEEWKRVAHYLGLRWVRIQAIMRTVSVGERTEQEAKYDMLVTWHRRATRAMDKVSTLSSALRHCERYDLADTVLDRGREFGHTRRAQVTFVN